MSKVEKVSLWEGGPLWGMCPGVVQLGFDVGLFLLFEETAKLIFRVALQVCPFTSNGGMFARLHILASIC